VLKAAAFPIADERLGERVCLRSLRRDGTAGRRGTDAANI